MRINVVHVLHRYSFLCWFHARFPMFFVQHSIDKERLVENGNNIHPCLSKAISTEPSIFSSMADICAVMHGGLLN